MDYKQRKKLGIQTCNEIISNDFRFQTWHSFFQKHNKKDDLSDCFLQGIWYLRNQNIITYADDLKINIV
jgi:hypothetical protein